MKILLTILTAVLISAQNVRALELGEVNLAGITSIEVPKPEVARAENGISTYRSLNSFETKAGAFNAMMNAEARLLKTDVAIFEKRVVGRAGGKNGFELKYLSAARVFSYSSKASYLLAALALNSAMNSEASMLKGVVPVLETLVLRKADGAYYYKIVFLSGAEVKTFSPERTFVTALGALNELYNTESRLLAGRVGVVEKRVIAAPAGGYSFEITYAAAAYL
ncbi:MAG: hypothetical protein NTY45_10270 [Elusimicrobia bacterium]|nr:hypothetical protein [Elusimicrobiota bacterium]